MKRALITGINGQDGSYLADFLLNKGYIVYGMERRCSRKNRVNTGHLEGKIAFVNGDLSDQNSLLRCIKESQPDEIYNLGAMSFVGESWNTPETTGDIDALGVLRMLEAIREYGMPIKFYQASTSEMFGKVTETPQKETTRFYPRSPYGVSKLYGHWITKNYRESYGIFACSGILFNHESERRGTEFVTRKVTQGVAAIHLGLEENLVLGNLDDYVIGTGKSYSIRDLLRVSFECIGIDDWQKYVKTDKSFLRPAEVDNLIADYSKTKRVLGWEPKTKFEDMIAKMVANDIEILNKK